MNSKISGVRKTLVFGDSVARGNNPKCTILSNSVAPYYDFSRITELNLKITLDYPFDSILYNDKVDCRFGQY